MKKPAGTFSTIKLIEEKSQSFETSKKEYRFGNLRASKPCPIHVLCSLNLFLFIHSRIALSQWNSILCHHRKVLLVSFSLLFLYNSVCRPYSMMILMMFRSMLLQILKDEMDFHFLFSLLVCEGSGKFLFFLLRYSR